VIVRLVGVLSHFIYLEDARNHKPKIQWTEESCSVPKKIRSVPSAGKVMVSVFWNAEGIMFIDYLEKGKTITGEYYSNLLTRLDNKNS
jgi:hypothetical protein